MFHVEDSNLFALNLLQDTLYILQFVLDTNQASLVDTLFGGHFLELFASRPERALCV